MAEPLAGMTTSLKLRQRSSWEAADSGVLLWRNNFLFFIILMILPFIAIAVILRFSPLQEHQTWTSPVSMHWAWTYFILWWLKPLFARPVLHVISVRFFEPQASFSRIIKGFAKSFFVALAGDLLWRRFSLWRAARMPVRTLEHLSGKAARMRIKTLEAGGLNFGAPLTIMTIVIFAALFIGEILFALLLLEMIQIIPLSALPQYMNIVEPIIFSLVCLDFILIEPLYVCMGFGIYINSRIEVEGWDIQLLLQNFVKQKLAVRTFPHAHSYAVSIGDTAETIPHNEMRPQPQSPSGVARSSGMLKTIIFISIGLFFIISPLSMQSVQAEENKIEIIEDASAPVDVLKQILSSPDFGGDKGSWGIRLKNQKEPKEMPNFNFAWIKKIKEFFGLLLFVVLILSIAFVAGYLLRRLYIFKKNKIAKKQKKWKSSFFTPSGITADPEALLAEARLLHNQGRIRDAWARCFLAAIVIYSIQESLEFPLDATEYDCLSIVKQAKARDAEGFGNLVLSWTALAYAGKKPDTDAFEKTLAFCNSLNQLVDTAVSHA